MKWNFKSDPISKTLYVPTVIFIWLTFFSLNTYAKVIYCHASDPYTGRGWLPKAFKTEISADRKEATIIEPKSDYFGSTPFKKNLIGVSLWARGKGKVTAGAGKGTYYNYRLQLDFSEGDSKAKAKMKMQGYRDIVQAYQCKFSSAPACLSAVNTSNPRSAAKLNLKQAPVFSELWEKNCGIVLGKNYKQKSPKAESVAPSGPEKSLIPATNCST